MIRVALFKTLVVLFLLLHSLTAVADTCPSTQEIKDREISRRYDWAVPENVSLEQLLAVEKLYAVRIMKYDDYVSCRYTTAKWLVTLDGDPLVEKCKVIPEQGEWWGTESGELVCQEKDVTQCKFKMECNE